MLIFYENYLTNLSKLKATKVNLSESTKTKIESILIKMAKAQ